jgi:hypothetical protein
VNENNKLIDLLDTLRILLAQEFLTPDRANDFYGAIIKFAENNNNIKKEINVLKKSRKKDDAVIKSALVAIDKNVKSNIQKLINIADLVDFAKKYFLVTNSIKSDDSFIICLEKLSVLASNTLINKEQKSDLENSINAIKLNIKNLQKIDRSIELSTFEKNDLALRTISCLGGYMGDIICELQSIDQVIDLIKKKRHKK